MTKGETLDITIMLSGGGLYSSFWALIAQKAARASEWQLILGFATKPSFRFPSNSRPRSPSEPKSAFGIGYVAPEQRPLGALLPFDVARSLTTALALTSGHLMVDSEWHHAERRSYEKDEMALSKRDFTFILSLAR